jgi:hypothetical protein
MKKLLSALGSAIAIGGLAAGLVGSTPASACGAESGDMGCCGGDIWCDGGCPTQPPQPYSYRWLAE